MVKSIRPVKPSKPYPDFPLFPHATGRWCKKIRGKSHYFGRWDDPDAALQKYLDEANDLHAGRTPRITSEGLTIADLCNRFLNAKKLLINTGELTDRTFRSYYRACAGVVSFFGKNRLVYDLAVEDFERFRSSLGEGVGPVTLSGKIVLCRMVFKYAVDSCLIDRPVRFGQAFNKPSKKVLRVNRNNRGKRMFEADELRAIIATAIQPLKAMTLMAINCGFGQSDLARLPQTAVDLENGWVDYPRPKTGVERRCPLWPETLQVLREAIEKRPKPKDEADDGLCFLTRFGNPWVRQGNQPDPGERSSMDLVSTAFGRMLKKMDVDGNRNFYALRHTFETIGGESRDQISVNAIMGHVDSSMAGVYRERISDERLRAVVDCVRGWLWPDVAETE